MRVGYETAKGVITKIVFFLLLLSTLPSQIKLPLLNVGIHNILIPMCASILILLKVDVVPEAIRYHRRAFVVLLMLVVWMWFSAFVGADRATALKFSAKYSFYPLILIAYLLLTFNEKNTTAYLKIVLYFLFLMGIGGVLELYLPHAMLYHLTKTMYLDTAYRISSLVPNPNIFGTLMAFGFIMGILLHSQKRIHWIEFYGGCLLFLSTVLFSGSRNALFVLLTGGIVLLFMIKPDILKIKKDRLKILGSGAAAVILICAMWIALPAWMVSNITDHVLHGSVSKRLLIWQAAVDEIIRHPISGIGVGVFPTLVGNKLISMDGFIHTHNLLLNILVEVGIVGLALAILFLYQLLRRADFSDLIILVPLIVLLIAQLVDYFMHDIVFTTVALLFIALAANSGPIERDEYKKSDMAV